MSLCCERSANSLPVTVLLAGHSAATARWGFVSVSHWAAATTEAPRKPYTTRAEGERHRVQGRLHRLSRADCTGCPDQTAPAVQGRLNRISRADCVSYPGQTVSAVQGRLYRLSMAHAATGYPEHTAPGYPGQTTGCPGQTVSVIQGMLHLDI